MNFQFFEEKQSIYGDLEDTSVQERLRDLRDMVDSTLGPYLELDDMPLLPTMPL